MILEEFELYCSRMGITSNQYKEEIFPVFAAGFTAHARRDLIHSREDVSDALAACRNYHPYSSSLGDLS